MVASVDRRPAIHRVNGFQHNLDADSAAARNWDLTTPFGSVSFAQSGMVPVLSELGRRYHQGVKLVVELGAGTALFGRVLCSDLHEQGHNPTLIISERQHASVRAIPDTPGVIRTVSDSLTLPLAPASERSPQVAVASRALTHYFPESTHQALIREVARVLAPGEVWVDQISSGDEIMRGGFQRVLRTISGKTMRYQGPDDYPKFVEAVVGQDGKPLFEASFLGSADPQPRGSVKLAQRYLEPYFQTRGINCVVNEDLARIAQAETRLSALVKSGVTSREQAISDLEGLIRNTLAFHIFRRTVVEEVRAHLQANKVSESPDLQIVQGRQEDVLIKVCYPTFGLTRTESPI